VRSGSSYLSQSELAVTFGLGKRDAAQKVVVEWPSGVTQEFANVKAGRYGLREGGLLTSA
jgi:enediyne biosynthesis protein E4